MPACASGGQKGVGPCCPPVLTDQLLRSMLPNCLQAWEHIRGREEQAMETLRRIAAETAAERQLKQQKVGASCGCANVAAISRCHC